MPFMSTPTTHLHHYNMTEIHLKGRKISSINYCNAISNTILQCTHLYSRPSVARTLMARLPRLFRTRS